MFVSFSGACHALQTCVTIAYITQRAIASHAELLKLSNYVHALIEICV